MREADAWRLERAESLDLFLVWRSLGAESITLSELLTLPGWLVRDFQKLGVRYQRARDRKKRREQGAHVSTGGKRGKPKRR
ncbi:MAG: hypothetical protein IT328_20165 [Caldilineaceae bacterium]|nr:hypothetical protein [Caldilineaceae bacterium]